MSGCKSMPLPNGLLWGHLEIIAEHHKLFGTSVNRGDHSTVDGSKETPMQYWRKVQRVSQRKELADAAEKTKNEEAEKRGYQKRVEEEANPVRAICLLQRIRFLCPSLRTGKTFSLGIAKADPGESELLNELQRARA